MAYQGDRVDRGNSQPLWGGVFEPWRCHGNYIKQTNLQLILLVSLNSLRLRLSLTACPRADHLTASSWYLSTGTRRPGLMSDFVLEWPVLTEECHDTSWDELTLSMGLMLNSFILTNTLDMYATHGEKQMGNYFFAFDYKCDCQTKSAFLTYYSKTPTLLP